MKWTQWFLSHWCQTHGIIISSRKIWEWHFDWILKWLHHTTSNNFSRSEMSFNISQNLVVQSLYYFIVVTMLKPSELPLPGKIHSYYSHSWILCCLIAVYWAMFKFEIESINLSPNEYLFSASREWQYACETHDIQPVNTTSKPVDQIRSHVNLFRLFSRHSITLNT